MFCDVGAIIILQDLLADFNAELDKKAASAAKDKAGEEKTKKRGQKSSGNSNASEDMEGEQKPKRARGQASNADDQPPKEGFERGLTAEEIKGATESKGEVKVLMKWVGSDHFELVPAKEANQKCPEVVIKFYEKHLTWLTPVQYGFWWFARRAQQRVVQTADVAIPLFLIYNMHRADFGQNPFLSWPVLNF